MPSEDLNQATFMQADQSLTGHSVDSQWSTCSTWGQWILVRLHECTSWSKFLLGTYQLHFLILMPTHWFIRQTAIKYLLSLSLGGKKKLMAKWNSLLVDYWKLKFFLYEGWYTMYPNHLMIHSALSFVLFVFFLFFLNYWKNLYKLLEKLVVKYPPNRALLKKFSRGPHEGTI